MEGELKVLRMVRIQNILLTILISFVILFKWIKWQWGEGIIMVIITMLILWILIKLNKKIKIIKNEIK